MADRCSARVDDTGGTGAQVARDRDVASRRELTDIFKILQKSAGVGEADPVGHRADKSARSAGAEGDARLGHQIGDRDRLGHIVQEPAEGCSGDGGGCRRLESFGHLADFLGFTPAQDHHLALRNDDDQIVDIDQRDARAITVDEAILRAK